MRPQFLFTALAVSLVSGAVTFSPEVRADLLAASWTQQATPPTSSLGGTLSPSTITGTTGAFSNAGSVSGQDWNSIGFVSSSGLGTITQVGSASVALGFAGSGTATAQTVNFSPSIVNPYLLINWTDNGDQFDFSSVGSSNVVLVSASNASLSNGIVTANGAGNTSADGFVVQLLGTFSSISFPITKTSAGTDSVFFTAVPEPTSLVGIASSIGFVALFARRRRRNTGSSDPSSTSCTG